MSQPIVRAVITPAVMCQFLREAAEAAAGHTTYPAYIAPAAYIAPVIDLRTRRVIG